MIAVLGTQERTTVLHCYFALTAEYDDVFCNFITVHDLQMEVCKSKYWTMQQDIATECTCS